MNRHSFIIAVSMLLGLVVAVVLYRYLLGLRQEMHKPSAQVATNATWVIAARDIPYREILKPDMLQTVRVPSSVLQQGAITHLDEAVGKSVSSPIAKGQFLLAANLRSAEPGSDLGFLLPAGYRAITVETSVVAGVGQMLKPDDMVDVLVYLDQKDVGKDMSFVFLRGLRVLATDQTMRNTQPPKATENGGLANAIGGQNKGYTSVTVAATPEDCAKINLAESMGRIRLVLRPPNAEEPYEPEYISYPQTLSAEANIRTMQNVAYNPAPVQKTPTETPRMASRPRPATDPHVSPAPAKPVSVAANPAPKGRSVTIIRGLDVTYELVPNSQRGDNPQQEGR